MPIVLLFCVVLLGATTAVHYEVLRCLNALLPVLKIPARTKLLVVIFGAFAAHAVEIALYGGGLYVLSNYFDVGTLSGTGPARLATCMYFSAEAFSSLGLGDVVPSGPIRLMAGVEALNGLLLIAWSASFAYLSMERFWVTHGQAPPG